MKKMIDVNAYMPLIMDRLAHGGILVSVQDDDTINPMTIGWLTIGTVWNKPICQIYIRHPRLTKGLLDKALKFSLNISMEQTDRVKQILAYCGTHSGRDVNKAKELDLHYEGMALKELPLTIECNVIYKVLQQAEAMPQDVIQKYYPNACQDPIDVHTVYYGQIEAAYILEEK